MPLEEGRGSRHRHRHPCGVGILLSCSWLGYTTVLVLFLLDLVILTLAVSLRDSWLVVSFVLVYSSAWAAVIRISVTWSSDRETKTKTKRYDKISRFSRRRAMFNCNFKSLHRHSLSCLSLYNRGCEHAGLKWQENHRTAHFLHSHTWQAELSSPNSSYLTTQNVCSSVIQFLSHLRCQEPVWLDIVHYCLLE